MLRHYVLIIFMISIGLVKMVGIAIDSKQLRSLAHTFASSPAPSPFYRFGGDTFIRCVLQDGSEKSFSWDNETRSSIAGPHRRNVTFLHMFALARHSEIGPAGNARVHSMISFHFCKKGSWGADLCGEVPKLVALEDRSKSSTTDHSFRHACRH